MAGPTFDDLYKQCKGQKLQNIRVTAYDSYWNPYQKMTTLSRIDLETEYTDRENRGDVGYNHLRFDLPSDDGHPNSRYSSWNVIYRFQWNTPK